MRHADGPSSTPRPGIAHRLASSLLFPLLVCALGSWALVGSGLDLAGPIGAPAVANDALVLGATAFVGYALIAALERILPYRPEWNRTQGDVGTDVVHFLFTGLIANALFRATLAGVYAAGATWIAARLGHGLWPGSWPLVAQLGLALTLAELGHYWFHRLAHERPLLWRLHSTHHSAPRLYWLNASRFHPLDLFGLLAFESAPLVLLGIEPRALLAFLIFRLVYGQIQHCNVDLASYGPLDRIFSSHALHRWHHSPDPREGNMNYGAVLSCWDLLFGTWFRPGDRRFTGTVGLDGLPAFPRGYLAQLAAPFRWRRIENAGVDRERAGARTA